MGRGPADQIVDLILKSDEISIIIGTRINIAHQDPTLPVELEIRRTVVKRIARILEEKFLKEVKTDFISRFRIETIVEDKEKDNVLNAIKKLKESEEDMGKVIVFISPVLETISF